MVKFTEQLKAELAQARERVAELERVLESQPCRCLYREERHCIVHTDCHGGHYDCETTAFKSSDPIVICARCKALAGGTQALDAVRKESRRAALLEAAEDAQQKAGICLKTGQRLSADEWKARAIWLRELAQKEGN